jgi:hypothetical protein
LSFEKFQGGTIIAFPISIGISIGKLEFLELAVEFFEWKLAVELEVEVDLIGSKIKRLRPWQFSSLASDGAVLVEGRMAKTVRRGTAMEEKSFMVERAKIRNENVEKKRGCNTSHSNFMTEFIHLTVFAAFRCALVVWMIIFFL